MILHHEATSMGYIMCGSSSALKPWSEAEAAFGLSILPTEVQARLGEVGLAEVGQVLAARGGRTLSAMERSLDFLASFSCVLSRPDLMPTACHAYLVVCHSLLSPGTTTETTQVYVAADLKWKAGVSRAPIVEEDGDVEQS